MKTPIILAILFISLAAICTPAQRCGGGTNQINVFVKDGVKLKDPVYELISISPTGLIYDDPKLASFISKTFFEYPDKNPARTFWYMKLFVIEPKLVDKFLRGYKFENYDPAPDWRPLDRKDFTGKIIEGYFELPTGEMFNYPYLLKISAGNLKPVYILGPHLWGCFPRERIILDGENSAAYIDSWSS